MYKCKICCEVSLPGEKIRRHAVYRRSGPLKGTIAQEFAVCAVCQLSLNILGVSLGSLVASHRSDGYVTLPAPAIPLPIYHGRSASTPPSASKPVATIQLEPTRAQRTQSNGRKRA